MLVGLSLHIIPMMVLCLFEKPTLAIQSQDTGYKPLTQQPETPGLQADAATPTGIETEDIESSLRSNAPTEISRASCDSLKKTDCTHSDTAIASISTGTMEEISTMSTEHEERDEGNKANVVSFLKDISKCYCFRGDVRLFVPSCICLADVITGIASGMTIKFFPIFFLDVLGMRPVSVSALYMIVPLFVSSTSLLAQKLSVRFGRILTTILLKGIGVTCLFMICFCVVSYRSAPVIVGLYVIRTTLMNSTKSLTKSVINDIVPKNQRGRWNALETVNAASWAGSAAVGGVLVDRYGFVSVIATTAFLQFVSIIPLYVTSKYVPAEGIDFAWTAEKSREAPQKELDREVPLIPIMPRRN
jgi:hypothetical protein